MLIHRDVFSVCIAARAAAGAAASTGRQAAAAAATAAAAAAAAAAAVCEFDRFATVFDLPVPLRQESGTFVNQILVLTQSTLSSIKPLILTLVNSKL